MTSIKRNSRSGLTGADCEQSLLYKIKMYRKAYCNTIRGDDQIIAAKFTRLKTQH